MWVSAKYVELAKTINEMQDVIDRLGKLDHLDRKYRDLDATR